MGRVKSTKDTKYCSGCDQELPRDQFYKHPAGYLISKCKKCCVARVQARTAKKKQQKEDPWFISY